MAQEQMTDVTVRLNNGLKASGESLFRSLGMNFSTAFNIFVKQSVKQGKIPFEIDDESIETAAVAETEEEYYAELRRRAADMDAGRNIVYHDVIDQRRHEKN